MNGDCRVGARAQEPRRESTKDDSRAILERENEMTVQQTVDTAGNGLPIP